MIKCLINGVGLSVLMYSLSIVISMFCNYNVLWSLEKPLLFISYMSVIIISFILKVKS